MDLYIKWFVRKNNKIYDRIDLFLLFGETIAFNTANGTRNQGL
jgi:hypothetical protein